MSSLQCYPPSYASWYDYFTSHSFSSEHFYSDAKKIIGSYRFYNFETSPCQSRKRRRRKPYSIDVAHLYRQLLLGCCNNARNHIVLDQYVATASSAHSTKQRSKSYNQSAKKFVFTSVMMNIVVTKGSFICLQAKNQIFHKRPRTLHGVKPSMLQRCTENACSLLVEK